LPPMAPQCAWFRSWTPTRWRTASSSTPGAVRASPRTLARSTPTAASSLPRTPTPTASTSTSSAPFTSLPQAASRVAGADMAAPTALASVAQLAEYIGEEIMANSADEKRAQWALRAASSLVRRNTGNRTWLEDDGSLVDPLPDDIVLVTLAAAARKYTNPEG